MTKALLFLKKEFSEMLPPTLFFLIVFHVVALIRAQMAEQYGISIASSASATVGALIVGKAMLIARALPPFRLFGGHPLIVNFVWRIFLYALAVLAIQFLEELIPSISKLGSLSAAADHVVREIQWHRFWATHLVLVMFLVFYEFAIELIGVVGSKKVVAMFFGTGQPVRDDA